MEQETLEYYMQEFVQTYPHVQKKDTWKTIYSSLSNDEVIDHIHGEKTYGTFSKWYSNFIVLDIDDKDIIEVRDIAQSISQNQRNYHILTSESPNSFHVIMPITYKNTVPTSRLIRETFKNYEKEYHIEIYPKRNHGIRLPYSQNHMQDSFYHPVSINFEKLIKEYQLFDPLDISDIPYSQQKLEFTLGSENWYSEAKELIDTGYEKGTRHHSQAKMIYFCWRQNMLPEHALKFVYDAIKKQSDKTSTNLRIIYKEIGRQVKWIYTHFECSSYLPDDIHLAQNGYLYKNQLIELIKITCGNLPFLKFCIKLFSYLQSRQYRTHINVHSDLLTSWSSKQTYLEYLDILIQKGVIRRSDGYIIGERAKQITPSDWSFIGQDKILNEEKRPPETAKEVITNALNQNEYRTLLKNLKVPKNTISMQIIKNLWQKVQKTRNI